MMYGELATLSRHYGLILARLVVTLPVSFTATLPFQVATVR